LIAVFAPLSAAAVLLLLPGLRRQGMPAAVLSVAGALASLAASGTLLAQQLLNPQRSEVFEVMWLPGAGSSVATIGIQLDGISVPMLAVVAVVATCVQLFSVGYMSHEPPKDFGRYFTWHALFLFTMQGLVVAPNLLQLFACWEMVGLCSYLLIGFYYTKPSAARAAVKAFWVTKLADMGLLLGLILQYVVVGDFGWGPSTVQVLVGAGSVNLVAGLYFLAVMGKSAQFPLHVWLPDAMEGPTPVSALMHAATMVAAGVYMISRCFFLYEDSSWAPTLLAWIGTITAFLAATIAITQSDIKKVLAYSTLSQLGYMTMALGAGAYTAAMFHLMTHAFFKALLFLDAGSAITGCHHEQDMFKMGGLRKLMPATFRTWMIGTFALCGIFPFAGFWSKDEILGAMAHADRVGGHTFLYVIGVLTAGLTAFYMGRATWIAFMGRYRGHAEVRESPPVMTLPLWFLAAGAVVLGFVGIPGGGNRFEHFLEAWHVGGPGAFHMSVALLSTILAVGGFVLAIAIYRKAEPGTDPLPRKLGGVWTLWSRLYYIDDFYLWLIKTVQQGIAHLCWLFDRWVIIGTMVNGTAYLTKFTGDKVRRIQDGRLSGYVTAFTLGLVVLGLAVLLASCSM